MPGDAKEKLWLRRSYLGSSMARRMGRFYLSLITDWSWLARKVERVSVVDVAEQKRHVSLDIEVAELRARARRFGLPGDALVPLPLLLAKKGLTSDLTITDQAGVSQSNMTRWEMRGIARLAMASAVRQANRSASREVESALSLVLKARPSAEDFTSWRDSGPGSPTSWTIAADHAPDGTLSASGAAQIAILDSLARDGSVSSIIDLFYFNTARSVWHRLDSNDEIYKVSYVEWVDVGASDGLPATDLDLSDMRIFDVQIPNLYPGLNEHFQIEVPEGVYIPDSMMFCGGDGDGYAYSYETHQSPRRHSFVQLSDSRGELAARSRVLTGAMYPRPDGIFLPVIFWNSIFFLVLFAGALGQLTTFQVMSLAASNGLDALVAVIFILPTVGLTFILRDGENAVRSSLLSMSRLWACAQIIPVAIALFALFVDFGYLCDAPVLSREVEQQCIGASYKSDEAYKIGYLWLLAAAFSLAILRRSFKAMLKLNEGQKSLRLAGGTPACWTYEVDSSSSGQHEAEGSWAWTRDARKWLPAFLVTLLVLLILCCATSVVASLVFGAELQLNGIFSSSPFHLDWWGVGLLVLCSAVASVPYSVMASVGRGVHRWLQAGI